MHLSVVGGRDVIHHDRRGGFVDGHLAINRQRQVVETPGILGRHAVRAGLNRQADAAVADGGLAQIDSIEPLNLSGRGMGLAIVGDLLSHEVHCRGGPVDDDLALNARSEIILSGFKIGLHHIGTGMDRGRTSRIGDHGRGDHRDTIGCQNAG